MPQPRPLFLWEVVEFQQPHRQWASAMTRVSVAHRLEITSGADTIVELSRERGLTERTGCLEQRSPTQVGINPVSNNDLGGRRHSPESCRPVAEHLS